MGDPGTKVILSLAQMYCFSRVPNALGCFCGDDVIFVTHSLTDPYEYKNSVSLLDCKLSDDSTYISDFCGHYAEEFIICPHSRMQRWDIIRKGGDVRNIPYIDYPRVRLILGVCKDDTEYSLTKAGKTTQLSHDAKWASQTWWDVRFQWACVFQDICLELRHAPRIPYLPTELGGYGFRPPNYLYWMESIRSFYSGRYLPIIKLLVHEATDFVEKKSALPVFTGTFTPFRKHFSGESWARRVQGVILPDHIQSRAVITADRLIQENYLIGPALVLIHEQKLIPATVVKSEWLSRVNILDLLTEGILPQDNDPSLNDELNEILETKVQIPDLLEDRYQSFYRIWMNEPYLLRNLRLPDLFPGEMRYELHCGLLTVHLFPDDIVDEPDELADLRVQSYLAQETYNQDPVRMLFSEWGRDVPIIASPVMKTALENLNLAGRDVTILEEAGISISDANRTEMLYSSFLKAVASHSPETIDRHLFQDDEFLLGITLSRYIVLVTNDKKLCENLSNMKGLVVYRWSPDWEDDIVNPLHHEILIDTGSHEATILNSIKICGIKYHLSGLIPQHSDLSHADHNEVWRRTLKKTSPSYYPNGFVYRPGGLHIRRLN